MAEEGEASVTENVEILAAYDDADLLVTLKAALEERPSVVQELVDWALPDRAYGSARIMTENRQYGTIKSFSEQNNYGFIDCPEVKEAFGNDVFVHGSQLNGNFAVGQEVSFALLLNKERKPQAFDPYPAHAGGKGKGSGMMLGGPGCKGGGGGGGMKGAGKPSPWDSGSKGSSFMGGAKGGFAWSQGPSAAWAGGWDSGPACWGPPGGKSWASQPSAKGGGGGGGKGKSGKPSASGDGFTPPETSMEMPGVTDRSFSGMVKSFNDQKGFGFIACDEIMEQFGGDVFLHHAQFYGLEVGQAVSFEVFLNKDGKPQAKQVSAEGGNGAGKWGGKRAADSTWGGGAAKKSPRIWS